MRYLEPLLWGTLQRRYKRFLADVTLRDGRLVTAHVPNSGAMRGCAVPGSPVLVAGVGDAGRRLAWRLEQVVSEGVPVGVNTQRANALAEEALCLGLVTVPGLGEIHHMVREVRLGESMRLDFLLTGSTGRSWLEVKNVSWVEGDVALFPDAVTARGTRHLEAMAGLVAAGEPAALMYVVQRGDARAVRAAVEVDRRYAAALSAARRVGVQVLAVQVAVAPHRLAPWRALPVLA